MGLFEKFGRKVERFKQAAEEAADDAAEYRCADCEAALPADVEECPECGSADVVRASEESGDEDRASEGASDGGSGSGDGQ